MTTTYDSTPPTSGLQRRVLTFWSIFPAVVFADFVASASRKRRLTLHMPEDVFGSVLRFTLTYNTGAAMNLSVGAASRLVFTVIAGLMLVVIFQMYRRAPHHDVAQSAALALIAAGALGNVIDRLRSTRGVVDFIDVGVGDARFWTFNIADAGVTVGAALLAFLLWRRPAQQERG